MRRLKILFLTTDLGMGGAERFLLDLTNYLDTVNSVDYRIGCLNKIIKYPEFENNDKIVFLDYIPFSFGKKRMNKKFTNLLDTFEPDIIHSHRFLAEFLTVYDLRRDIKYVCHCHDNMIQYRKPTWSTFLNKTRFINFLLYQIIKRKKYSSYTTWFITNSNHTTSFYKHVLPKSQKCIIREINYGFVFDKFFNPIKEYPPKVRLLNIASYQPKKNQKFIIEIAKVLRKRNIDFEINLLGAGSEYENIKQLISENKLENYVFQHGIQTNAEDWYRASDIYLHTAYYEPFGLVFLEAMAAGILVVALDGKGNKDIVKDGETGFFIAEENAEKFADVIVEVLQNQKLSRQIVSKAQSFSKSFDISLKGKELVDFYHSIID